MKARGRNNDIFVVKRKLKRALFLERRHQTDWQSVRPFRERGGGGRQDLSEQDTGAPRGGISCFLEGGKYLCYRQRGGRKGEEVSSRGMEYMSFWRAGGGGRSVKLEEGRESEGWTSKMEVGAQKRNINLGERPAWL